MNIHFEELSAPQRAGGIEAATRELAAHLRSAGLQVSRSSEQTAIGLPDCVHIHGIWSPQLAGKFLAWQKKGVPCIVSPHGMLEPWPLSHKWLKKKIAWHVYQKRLLNRAAALHGTSARETAQFRKLGLTPPSALVPWGVEMPPQNRKSEIGNRKSEIRTALFVGRIHPVKGLPMLIEAWAKVRPAGWKLKIVGPDEVGHRAEVEAVVQKTGLASVVEFVGELAGSAKSAAYDGADLFIQPSYTENFGMAIAEALAHSLPVITTTGTPWSILPKRGCGWCGDARAEPLAQALREASALTNEERQVMGQRGYDLVKENYSWPVVASTFLEVYRWVLQRGGKPACVS